MAPPTVGGGIGARRVLERVEAHADGAIADRVRHHLPALPVDEPYHSIEIVGPVMRAIGHVTPHAWALDAFVDLMGNRVGPSGVLTQVAVLLLFSAAILPLAGYRLRRAIGA